MNMEEVEKLEVLVSKLAKINNLLYKMDNNRSIIFSKESTEGLRALRIALEKRITEFKPQS